MTVAAIRRNEKKWDLWALLFLISLLIWRIIYVYIAPIELSPDEAYYWEWSRRLDWGYYSKPPMVAWIIGLATWLFGNTAFAVRLPAAILGSLSLLFCYLAARRFFSARTGFYALLLAAASPGACVAGFVMTIDAPLLCFWSLALLSVLNAVETECSHAEGSKRILWWLTTGFAAGAGFLTKQTMFAFWPVVIFFLAAGRDTRKILRSAGLYFSIFISLAALLPVIYWNIQHHWITLTHTAHHFEQSDRSIFESLLTFLEFAGSQLGVISPLTCILIFATGVSGLMKFRTFIIRKESQPLEQHDSRGPTRADLFNRTGGLLLMTGMAVLLPITMLSFKQRVNANWPAPFYIAPVIFTAAWHSGFLNLHPSIEKLKRLVKPAIITGAVMAVLVYLLPVLVPALDFEGTRLDPLVRVRGWQELAKQIDTIKSRLPRPEKTFLITRRRQTASSLAFYMKGNPMPYRWNGNPKRISTQYELWPGPEARKGWDALIIVDADKSLPSDLASHFKKFKKLETVTITIGRHPVRKFNIFFGSEFRP